MRAETYQRYFVGEIWGLLIGELELTQFPTYEACLAYLKTRPAPDEAGEEHEYVVIGQKRSGDLEVLRTLTWSYFDFHEDNEPYDIWEPEDES